MTTFVYQKNVMTTRTTGIVLRYLKYGENSVIAHIYTKDYGRQSFIFKGVKSRKTKQKLNILQPLFLLDIPINYRDKKDLYTGNGATLSHSFHSIPFSYTKNAIAFFLAEFLSKTLQAQESDKQLFDFIETSILQLDTDTAPCSNFHLHFLIKFMKYIGIQPANNRTQETPFLSVAQGEYLSEEQPDSFDFADSTIFATLETGTWAENSSVNLCREQRNKLLENLLKYYTYHISELKQMKSLSVLNELFS